jgi:hypothetical protein
VTGASVAAVSLVMLTSAATPQPFSASYTRNVDAQFAGNRVYKVLMRMAPERIGGERITPSGVLEVSLVGRPSPELRAAVEEAAADRDESVEGPSGRGPVRVRFRSVANSERSLRDLTMRIAYDSDRWKARGIEYAHWGPDYHANKVGLYLTRYTPEAAAKLEKAYGTSRFFVERESRPPGTRF